MRQGWLRPGEPANDAHTQYVMPDTFNPAMRGNYGHEIVYSPKGEQAPVHLVNYTPATGEVHDAGQPAPIEHDQLSIRPTGVVAAAATTPLPSRAAPVLPRSPSRGWAGGGAGAVGMGQDDDGDGQDDENAGDGDEEALAEALRTAGVPESVITTVTNNPAPSGPGESAYDAAMRHAKELAGGSSSSTTPPKANDNSQPQVVRTTNRIGGRTTDIEPGDFPVPEAPALGLIPAGGYNPLTQQGRTPKQVYTPADRGFDRYDPISGEYIDHIGPGGRGGTGGQGASGSTSGAAQTPLARQLGLKPGQVPINLGTGKGYDIYEGGKKVDHIGPGGSVGGAGGGGSPGGTVAGVDLDAVAAKVGHGVTGGLLRSLINEESGGRTDAVSSAGAIGLTQLMPGTAASLGVNPHDPYQNVVGGATYLAQMLDKFGGDLKRALIAYNAGPGGGAPAESVAYADRVIAGAGSSPTDFGPVDRVAINGGRGGYDLYRKGTNIKVGHQGPDGTTTGSTATVAGVNSRFRTVTDGNGNVFTVDQATGEQTLVSTKSPWRVVPGGNGSNIRVNVETGETQQVNPEASRQAGRSIFQVNPVTGQYEEVVRAPAELKVQMTADGKRITTIDPDTGAGRIIWVQDNGGLRNIPGMGILVPPGKKVTVQTKNGPVVYDGGPANGPDVRMQDIPAMPGRTTPGTGGPGASANASRVVNTANAQPGTRGLISETYDPDKLQQGRDATAGMSADLLSGSTETGASSSGAKVPSPLELFGALDYKGISTPTPFVPGAGPGPAGSGDSIYEAWKSNLHNPTDIGGLGDVGGLGDTGDMSGGMDWPSSDDQSVYETSAPYYEDPGQMNIENNDGVIDAGYDEGDGGDGDGSDQEYYGEDYGEGQRVGRGADEETPDEQASEPSEEEPVYYGGTQGPTPAAPPQPPPAWMRPQDNIEVDPEFDAWHDQQIAKSYLDRGLIPDFQYGSDMWPGDEDMTSPYSPSPTIHSITGNPIVSSTYTSADELAAGRRRLDQERAIDRARRIEETRRRLGITRVGGGEAAPGPVERDITTGADPNANPVIGEPTPPPPPAGGPPDPQGGGDFGGRGPGGGDIGSTAGGRGAASTSYGGVRGRLSGRLATGRSLEGWEPVHAATSTDVLGQELASSTGAPPPAPTTPEPPAVGTGGDMPAHPPASGWTPPVPEGDIVGGGNKFGDNVSMEGVHKGTDLQAVKGTPTVSPVTGIVTRVEFKKAGLGLQVVIRDEDGQEHRLSHLDKALVEPGQMVEKGDRVATVGESGTGATGPHLDYRVEQDGQEINPEPMMGDLANLPPHPDTIQEDGSVGAAGAEVGTGKKMKNRRHNPMNLDMHNGGVGNDLRMLAMNDQRSGGERPNFGPSGMWDQAGNVRSDFSGDWGKWGKAAKKQGYFGVGADEENGGGQEDPEDPGGGWEDPGGGEDPPTEVTDPFTDPGGGSGGFDPSNLGTLIPSGTNAPWSPTRSASAASSGRSAASRSGGGGGGSSSHDALQAAEDQIAWDREKFAQQLAWEQSQFGQQLGWDQSKFAQDLTWQQQKWMQDLQFQKDKLNVDVQRLNSDAQAEYRRYQVNLQQAQTQRAAAVEEMRHNRAMEILGRYQSQLDARNQALNRQQQRVLQGTYAQHRQAELQDSALKNPWVQSLTGMAPEYGQSGGPGWTPGNTPNGYATLMGGYIPMAPPEEPWEPIPTEPVAPGDATSGSDPNDPFNIWLNNFLTQNPPAPPADITNPNTPTTPITPITMPSSTYVPITAPGTTNTGTSSMGYNTLAQAIYGEGLQGVGHYNIDQMSQDDLNGWLQHLWEGGSGWDDPRIVKIMDAAARSGYDTSAYNQWKSMGNQPLGTPFLSGARAAESVPTDTGAPPDEPQAPGGNGGLDPSGGGYATDQFGQGQRSRSRRRVGRGSRQGGVHGFETPSWALPHTGPERMGWIPA